MKVTLIPLPSLHYLLVASATIIGRTTTIVKRRREKLKTPGLLLLKFMRLVTDEITRFSINEESITFNHSSCC